MKHIAELREIILKLAEPLVKVQNLEIWGLEVHAGPVLRVILYVDPLPRNASCASELSCSASIEQCESISRQLSLSLDVEDCIDQAWNLEVSSPGLERRFFALSQMAPYVGDLVEARLEQSVEDRKTWRGKLLKVGETDFEVQPCAISADGEISPEDVPSVAIPWNLVIRAKRLYVFTPPQKPGKRSASGKKQAH